EKFYGARDYAPVWTQAGSLSAAAKGVIARLKDAASDGLNPSDYPVPDFAAATTPDALAEAELKLTASMFDYARQAQSGRMHWSQLRDKLGITEKANDDHYDATVAEAVRKLQDGAEIKVTGVLDAATVKALNSPKRDKQIDTVLVNMERWRWLPRDLGVPSLG